MMVAAMFFCCWRSVVYRNIEDAADSEAKFERIEEAQIAFDSQK
jgi:hypothetical protein